MNEQALVNQAKAYLTLKGHYVWRNNTGRIHSDYVDKKGGLHHRMWQAGVKGSSDLIGVAADGRFIAIECKVGRNKATQFQLDFLEAVRSRGGIAVIIYSLDDLQKIL